MEIQNQDRPGLKGLITDVDGTLTDHRRRIHTGAIEAIRELVDHGICVVLASGNTACFMDALCKMIGTGGTYIAENGGIYRTGYSSEITILGDGSAPREALGSVVRYYEKKGIAIEHYSLPYRFVDVAFAHNVPVEEVREVLLDSPVVVLDTGFAIHLHPPGVSKGKAFPALVRALGMKCDDFLAIGDAENDIELLEKAGTGVAVANAHPAAARAADWVSEKEYGDGFIEAARKYFPFIFSKDTGPQ